VPTWAQHRAQAEKEGLVQVTNNLILTVPPGGLDAMEVSRVLPTQSSTLFAVTVQVGSTTIGITTVAAKLQWSNDMDN
jgi:hypothetical protein